MHAYWSLVLRNKPAASQPIVDVPSIANESLFMTSGVMPSEGLSEHANQSMFKRNREKP